MLYLAIYISILVQLNKFESTFKDNTLCNEKISDFIILYNKTICLL